MKIRVSPTILGVLAGLTILLIGVFGIAHAGTSYVDGTLPPDVVVYEVEGMVFVRDEAVGELAWFCKGSCSGGTCPVTGPVATPIPDPTPTPTPDDDGGNCNRGIGNGSEDCDPGNSSGQGRGQGRRAGEDRDE